MLLGRPCLQDQAESRRALVEGTRDWRDSLAGDRLFVASVFGLIPISVFAYFYLSVAIAGLVPSPMHWTLIIIDGLLFCAAIMVIAHRLRLVPKFFRFAMSRRRLCDRCGYSLRGLRSENCPECGAPAM